MAASKTNTPLFGDMTLHASQIHLDPLHPRFSAAGLKSEAQIIEKLCSKANAYTLAQHIMSKGSLSPLEVLGVVNDAGHAGHVIAVEVTTAPVPFCCWQIQGARPRKT